MKLGTSLRFIFPNSDNALITYQRIVASLPPGAFIERPMGAIGSATQAKNLLDIARAAEEAKLWSLLVGDNHSIPASYSNCFSPIPTISRLSAETGSLSVGAVFLAPFYHPMMLAEQIGTTSAFVDAETIWVFVVGNRQGAFDAFGIPMAERAKRTAALVNTLRDLLAGKTVTAAGPGWELNGAVLSPLPRHPAHLLIGGAAPVAIERAGRIGDGWVTAQNASDDELQRDLAVYRRSADRHGRSFMPVLRRDIHVAESDAKALEHIVPILEDGYRGVGLDRLLVGSPSTVLQRLAEYRDMGFRHVLVRHITGDHGAMLDSFGLIGQHVVQEISGWD